MEFGKHQIKKESDWMQARFIFPNTEAEQCQERFKQSNSAAKSLRNVWSIEECQQFEMILKSFQESGISPTLQFWEQQLSLLPNKTAMQCYSKYYASQKETRETVRRKKIHIGKRNQTITSSMLWTREEDELFKESVRNYTNSPIDWNEVT